MRWDRFTRNCAFAVMLFLLVNVIQVVRLPGTETVREYIAFAFTTDWDYQAAIEQARSGMRALTSYTGRIRQPEPAPGDPPPFRMTAPPPATTRDGGAGGTGRLPAVPGESTAAPSGRPAERVEKPVKLVWPAKGRISAKFGLRTHPIYRLAGAHEGIDLGAASGAPVVAAADGRVTATFRGLRSGLTIDLAHDGFTTRYAHLSAIKVRTGETVKAGTLIGLVGSTGVSTGPHLHFEVRLGGQPVDPLPLLPR